MPLLFEMLQFEGIVQSPVLPNTCKELSVAGSLVTHLLSLGVICHCSESARAAEWPVRRQLQHREYSCSITIILGFKVGS